MFSHKPLEKIKFVFSQTFRKDKISQR